MVMFSQGPCNFCTETSSFSLVKIISRMVVPPSVWELKLLARNVKNFYKQLYFSKLWIPADIKIAQVPIPVIARLYLCGLPSESLIPAWAIHGRGSPQKDPCLYSSCNSILLPLFLSGFLEATGPWHLLRLFFIYKAISSCFFWTCCFLFLLHFRQVTHLTCMRMVMLMLTFQVLFLYIPSSVNQSQKSFSR